VRVVADETGPLDIGDPAPLITEDGETVGGAFHARYEGGRRGELLRCFVGLRLFSELHDEGHKRGGLFSRGAVHSMESLLQHWLKLQQPGSNGEILIEDIATGFEKLGRPLRLKEELGKLLKLMDPSKSGVVQAAMMAGSLWDYRTWGTAAAMLHEARHHTLY